MGHALTNNPDVEVPRHVFFPSNDTNPDDDPTTYRRFTRSLEDAARRTRAAGKLQDAGSRLLKTM